MCENSTYEAGQVYQVTCPARSAHRGSAPNPGRALPCTQMGGLRLAAAPPSLRIPPPNSNEGKKGLEVIPSNSRNRRQTLEVKRIEMRIKLLSVKSSAANPRGYRISDRNIMMLYKLFRNDRRYTRTVPPLFNQK